MIVFGLSAAPKAPTHTQTETHIVQIYNVIIYVGESQVNLCHMLKLVYSGKVGSSFKCARTHSLTHTHSLLTAARQLADISNPVNIYNVVPHISLYR